MFADLLFALAIATSPAAAPSQAAANVDRTATSATPSCMTGPVRVRFRTQGGMVQIAANAIRIDGVDRPADGKARAE